MLTLINTNRMLPAIAPIGLDYIAGAVQAAGIEMDILDLCFSDCPDEALAHYFENHRPDLVGITFRNVDDCFWPSGESFVPDLTQVVQTIQTLTDAPVVIGGVGFSLFARQIVAHTGADFGIRGDGEQATVALLSELRSKRRFDRVDGLLWREKEKVRANPASWPRDMSLPTARDAIANATYFRRGGQAGIETKRGCDRHCTYCADAVAKGTVARLRAPAEVADEAESLLQQGVDVLHLCDSEFNIPASHANAICEEFIRRRLANRLRWYTYMAVVPFDDTLARNMRHAGCVGIDFTGDSGSDAMLKNYRQAHDRQDLAQAVQLCHDHDITVMVDLLLGGPGETPATVAETIAFMKQINPDCVGAALGVRIYPHTTIGRMLRADDPAQDNPNIHRKYDGTIDLLKPTFYLSSALGDRPTALVRDLIAGDQRFFEPMEEVTAVGDTCVAATGHNYNTNMALVQAIAAGDRGAFWDILRHRRSD